MTEDRDVQVLGTATSASVPSSDVVLHLPLQASPFERPTLAIFSTLSFAGAVGLVILAAQFAQSRHGYPMVLVFGGAAGLFALFAASGLRACFRNQFVEVTATEIQIVTHLFQTRIERAQITEANIVAIAGNRCLVVATPKKRAVVQQRFVPPEDWTRLIALVAPTET